MGYVLQLVLTEQGIMPAIHVCVRILSEASMRSCHVRGLPTLFAPPLHECHPGLCTLHQCYPGLCITWHRLCITWHRLCINATQASASLLHPLCIDATLACAPCINATLASAPLWHRLCIHATLGYAPLWLQKGLNPHSSY